MKQIFFLFAFIPLVALGQFSKGSKSIGGVILYNANEIENINNQPPNVGELFLFGK